MKNIAILIGAGTFTGGQLQGAKYATENAEALSAAFESAGIAADCQTLLVDDEVTPQAVASAVSQAVSQIDAGGTLYFFYSGFGFAVDGANYLVCSGTESDDPQRGSLEFQPVLNSLIGASCKQVVIFFDGCDCLPELLEESGKFKQRSLEDAVEDAAHCVCLASCKSNETSHASRSLKSSIWVHHLVEAVSGEAGLPAPLTASALQQYLQAETPRTLTRTLASAGLQSPQMYGNGALTIAAAGQPLLAGASAMLKGNENLYDGVSLRSETHQRLRDMPGWKRTHRKPERADSANNAFIGSLAEEALTRDLDNVFGGLKKAFSFKRRDVVAEQPTAGAGSILTPYFNYSISVELNPEDLTEVVWTRQVDAIRQPAQLATPAFEEVFESAFDTIDCTFPAPIDLEAFVDAVEEAELPDLVIDYDREVTYCNLELHGAAGDLRLTSGLLSIEHKGSTPVSTLVESFEMIRSFVFENGIPLLPVANGR